MNLDFSEKLLREKSGKSGINWISVFYYIYEAARRLRIIFDFVCYVSSGPQADADGFSAVSHVLIESCFAPIFRGLKLI